MNLHIAPMGRALIRNKARSLLALGMTVLTFAVVVNCLQLIRAQQAELERRSGVVDEELVYIDIESYDPSLAEPAALRSRIVSDLELLRAHPGVIDAMNTRFMPWRGGGRSGAVRPYGSDAVLVQTQNYTAGPNLANTLGVDIVGKPLTLEEMNDDDAGESVENTAGVIVTRKLADTLFPGEDPLGELLEWGSVVIRIDGVIEHLYNPYAWDIEELVMFFPGYTGSPSGTSFLVRVNDALLGDLASLETAVLRASDQRGVQIETISETRREFNAASDMVVASLTLVIALMVFVSAVSIIGLTASSVASRSRQIGTRRALGATSGAILQHFLIENGLLTACGLALGLAAAYALNLLLVTQMGAPKLEPSWVAVAALLVAVTNAAAALHPALRGAKIPPAMATKAS